MFDRFKLRFLIINQKQAMIIPKRPTYILKLNRTIKIFSKRFKKRPDDGQNLPKTMKNLLNSVKNDQKWSTRSFITKIYKKKNDRRWSETIKTSGKR